MFFIASNIDKTPIALTFAVYKGVKKETPTCDWAAKCIICVILNLYYSMK